MLPGLPDLTYIRKLIISPYLRPEIKVSLIFYFFYITSFIYFIYLVYLD